MSYQVLARKYRPQRFSDVVGQEHVTQTLANAIQQNRIAHAYLFVGPRGTGKTTIARIFAKCLNATGGPTTDFADDDPRVKEITSGHSLDVLEIDGASNRGIEEIRELRETVKYSPSNSRFKIYIIDEVHMLTKEAFNALLKTLEEPPEHVKFMFATTEPEKVLPTILSRCQRFDLRRIPSPLIIQHLGEIARQENVQIDEPALNAIARGSEGCMRDAESTLDQLISFCGEKIVEADVLAMFGLTARAQILSLSQAILQAQTEKALREFNDLVQNGKDLGLLLSDLLNHFRNILLYQISKGDGSLLEVSEAELQALTDQSTLADSSAITRIMDVFTHCEGRLREVASKKIFIEVTLLKAIQARQAVDIDTLLGKLLNLREQSGPPQPQVPATTPTPPATSSRSEPPDASPAPVSPETARPAVVDLPSPSDRDTLWRSLLESVAAASPFTHTYLLKAHPVSFEKSILTIGFDPQVKDQLSLLDTPRNRALLQQKLEELGCHNPQLKFVEALAPEGYHAPEPEPPPSAATAPRPATAPTKSAPSTNPPKKDSPPASVNLEQFKNDPLIQQALEIFKGQIVDVRP